MQVSSDIAEPLDITAKRGDTFEVNLNITDTDGADFVFTTHTALMQVRDALASEGGALVLTLDSAANEIVMSTGRLQLIKASGSMSISPGDYFYDVQVTYPDGKVKTWFSGTFSVTDEVTS